MSAMQKSSVSNQDEDDEDEEIPVPQLKVPKLKLKLSKPFQEPVESEQSSSESDSESDNDNDDEMNTSQEQHDASIEQESIHNQLEQQPFSQLHSHLHQSFAQPALQQQQPEQLYPYDAENSSIKPPLINNNNYEENVNESGSSTKNTSVESEDKSMSIDREELFATLPDESGNQLQMQLPQAQPIQEQTTDVQQNIFAQESDNVMDVPKDNLYPPLNHSENVMTPPDSIVDGQSGSQIGADNENQLTNMVEETMDNNQQELIEMAPPEVFEDKRPITEFILDQPLDRIPIRDFIRKCLQFTYPTCLYCNHARSIAVDGVSLAEHMIGEHRFSATVDSITAEELLPETIEQKISAGITELEETFFNMETYDNKTVDTNYQYVKHFECFQCRFYSPIYKDLYLHNRKMHLRSALICLMCRSNFYSYSELVCHMCPGAQTKLIPIDLKFRCVLCNLGDIPSAFRLMVHLRKKHSACDVCLEECWDQGKLSCHVWKHKLHHLCYRCNITYRNKADITRHLFWKHGTESVMCKRCLEKKWPHVYHFCVPPASFKCEICNLTFTKALTLKVHKRMHDPRCVLFPCSLEYCEEKFVSKKLQIKHISLHYMPEPPPPSEEKELVQEVTVGDLQGKFLVFNLLFSIT